MSEPILSGGILVQADHAVCFVPATIAVEMRRSASDYPRSRSTARVAGNRTVCRDYRSGSCDRYVQRRDDRVPTWGRADRALWWPRLADRVLRRQGRRSRRVRRSQRTALGRCRGSGTHRSRSAGCPPNRLVRSEAWRSTRTSDLTGPRRDNHVGRLPAVSQERSPLQRVSSP